jgi:hypothetical protein
MPERTMLCPTGCHEDYLTRDHAETPIGKEKWAVKTFYYCRKCEWEATWTIKDGLHTTPAPKKLGHYQCPPEMEMNV